MTHADTEGPVDLKALSRDIRSQVVTLANRGERHPDPDVAAAAYRWSHAPRWNSLANRLPGWLLPALGALFVVFGFVVPAPFGLQIVFIAGGALVVVFGVLGWLSTSTARTLRKVYREESSA